MSVNQAKADRVRATVTKADLTRIEQHHLDVRQDVALELRLQAASKDWGTRDAVARWLGILADRLDPSENGGTE